MMVKEAVVAYFIGPCQLASIIPPFNGVHGIECLFNVHASQHASRNEALAIEP
jgi:hypothetical protein